MTISISGGFIFMFLALALLLLLLPIVVLYERWALRRAEKKAGVKYRAYAHGTVDDFIRHVNYGQKLTNF